MDLHPSRAATGLAALVAAFALALPAAQAHVERPAYFPDPTADGAVSPAAGGGVPKVRSLASALDDRLPGRTYVVCQRDSIARLKQSLRRARAGGYEVRPSDRRGLSARQARRLLRVNVRLRRRCGFNQIQPAVDRAGNNDRVVIMPGVYTEPRSRAMPTDDPACDHLRTDGDRPGEDGNALSYAYQLTCPNDQNLVAVMGRAIGAEPDPVPPRRDRHGIPNAGACIRCNLQMEGSGVSADDVVVDAGDTGAGNGGPNGAGSKKDVAIRADRADGFVLRNVTVRHAGEHGVYVIETDGYLLDRFKAYYSRLYGTLTFASDHGVQQNCDAAGHGDSGIYPGGAPETGVQRPAGTDARYNQEIRRCDLHHNLAGYSGTNGNAVHVHDNDVYDNALGIQTDVVTGAGHPGYPGDSALFEGNRIHSNNFNTYMPGSDVKPSFPFPTGTGLWIAGGNHHKVKGNWFYDNWRRGTMLFSVPDSLVCGPAAGGNEQAGCDSTKVSTSHYNQTYDNKMGVRPDGRPDPNGTDFWWDAFAGSRGNCWFRNTGPKAITTSPAGLPDCEDGRDPALSVGTGSTNQLELISCVIAFETRNFDPDGPCPWIRTPPEPRAAARTAGSGPAFAPLAGARTTAAAPRASRSRIPLGQLTCTDWNGTAQPARTALLDRIRGFAGGVVNDGSRDLGTGAVLTHEQAAALYDGWCGQAYASEFLLVKLYTHAAAFSRRR
ncbi:MAG TPA: right-handed parallel beta-helix repeat-containing protein [Solirubrobacteraceae bacterium]|jgi:hypothetical protein|nr:right-handed parallel beta-helix repeat-containing protein [Solirubrobacteraceae bacterium]